MPFVFAEYRRVTGNIHNYTGNFLQKLPVTKMHQNLTKYFQSNVLQTKIASEKHDN